MMSCPPAPRGGEASRISGAGHARVEDRRSPTTPAHLNNDVTSWRVGPEGGPPAGTWPAAGPGPGWHPTPAADPAPPARTRPAAGATVRSGGKSLIRPCRNILIDISLN